MKKFFKNPWVYIVIAAILTTAGITILVMSRFVSPAVTMEPTPVIVPASTESTPVTASVPGLTPTPTPVPTPVPTPNIKPFPQLDSSTARKDMAAALYEDFVVNGDMQGPKPLCSKTHQAICNLIDGKVDVVFALYPSSEELDYMIQKKVDLLGRCYAYDALLILGNAKNPVEGLSVQQLKDIYRGKITNWSEVGGPDAPIAVYVRDSQSGSQRMFESLVWSGEENKPDFTNYSSMEQYDDMGTITDAIENNEYAIGYNFMTYIDGEYGTSTELKSFAIDGVAASYKTVSDGSYPFITTAWILIRADAPVGSPAQWFFDWFVGQNSQGYILDYTSSIPAENSVRIKAEK